MSIRVLTVVALATATLVTSSLMAQKMPEKWDKKCLEDNGKTYIACHASAGKDLKAQQKCADEKAANDKKCKLSK